MTHAAKAKDPTTALTPTNPDQPHEVTMTFQRHATHASGQRPRRLAALLSTMVLGAIVATPAHAIVFNVSCNTLTGWIAGSRVDFPTCDDSYADLTGTRQADVHASSFMGVLRASSRTLFTEQDTTASADAHAQWQMDGIVIDAPDASLQGQDGRLYFDMSFNGSISASGAAEARVVLQGGNTNYDGLQDALLYSAVINPESDFTSDRTQGRFIPFRFGEAIDLRFTLDTLAWRGRSSNGTPFMGPGQARADFAQSFYWGGIADVTDDAGRSVTGYTLTVPGGFDLTNPVPEPQTYVLFGAGLLMLASRLRAGQRQRSLPHAPDEPGARVRGASA